MKMIKVAIIEFLVFFLVLFCIKKCFADDWSFKGGPSIENGKAKYFALRHESDKFYGVGFGTELGAWVDNSGRGQEGALIITKQLGISPGADTGVFGKAFIGPALISNTDTVLGGYFQFKSDIGFGVRDEHSFVCVNYSHISSAGLSRPNKGRDWLLFEIGLRF